MLDEMVRILNFMVEAFLHVWPFVLVTIPIAVAVNLTGASRYIERALKARPVAAIVLATLVGAFSPFCSCSVIPVVAALLLGGVPLAPVMSFWIASPSMDPEIFLLSVATIGWELAFWRLGATLVVSLAAGFATHLALGRGWLGKQILRPGAGRAAAFARSFAPPEGGSGPPLFRCPDGGSRVRAGRRWPAATGRWPSWLPRASARPPRRSAAAAPVCRRARRAPRRRDCRMRTTAAAPPPRPPLPAPARAAPRKPCPSARGSGERPVTPPGWSASSWPSPSPLEAIMILYVSAEWVTAALGGHNPLAILTAALVGVPVYTSSLAALPMIGGLLIQGMDPAATPPFRVVRRLSFGVATPARQRLRIGTRRSTSLRDLAPCPRSPRLPRPDRRMGLCEDALETFGLIVFPVWLDALSPCSSPRRAPPRKTS